jgi:hypothetical protein
MPIRVTVEKLSPRNTAGRFLLFVVFAILAWLLYKLGYWSRGQGVGDFIETHRQYAFGFRDYLACLSYGGVGTSIGLSAMFLESVMNQSSGPGYFGLGILGIVFVILLFCLPVTVIACIIILINGGIAPPWL